MPFRICTIAAQAAAILRHAGSTDAGQEDREFEDTGNEEPRPANVVLIMADQMRADHFSPELTPNLWKLTERGANFERAFASAPICPAARASLLTGLSPWRHGLRGYGSIPPRYEQELASFFASHGYKTASIGKNHFGKDEFGARIAHGYQSLRTYEGLQETDDYTRWFEGMRPGEDPLKSGGISCDNPGPNAPPAGQWPHEDWCWNTWKSTTYEYPEDYHPTMWTADEAIKYISTAGNGPWFIKVSFHRPHSPYDPPKRIYDATAAPTRLAMRAKDGWDDEFRYNCTTSGVRDTSCGEVPFNELIRTRRAYRAAVRHVDEQAGRVLKMIDTATTWVMFVSDHGDMLNDHYLWRKSVPYQGSVHIPMVLAWPTDSEWSRLAEPGHRRDLAELRDVFPTLVKASGIKLSTKDQLILDQLDGIDLQCALAPDDDIPCTRQLLDLEHSNVAPIPRAYSWNAVTDGEMKYIFFRDGVEQLFNLTADPREEYELTRLPQYANEVAMWRSRMIEQFIAQGRGSQWTAGSDLVQMRPLSVFSPHYPIDLQVRATDLLAEDRIKTDKKRLRLRRQKKVKASVKLF